MDLGRRLDWFARGIPANVGPDTRLVRSFQVFDGPQFLAELFHQERKRVLVSLADHIRKTIDAKKDASVKELGGVITDWQPTLVTYFIALCGGGVSNSDPSAEGLFSLRFNLLNRMSRFTQLVE
jgi:hypothetical protein